MAKPIVAVVGRPNVGKSTLFNRLIGERRAIVQDEPGTTRDRVYGEVEWNGVSFALVDTGGMMVDERGAELDLSMIPAETRKQAEYAIEEADVIVMVVDVGDGTTAADLAVADLVRRTAKPVVLAANKAREQHARRQCVGLLRARPDRPDCRLLAARARHGRSARRDCRCPARPMMRKWRRRGRVSPSSGGRMSANRACSMRILGQERADRQRRTGHDARLARYRTRMGRADDHAGRYGGYPAARQDRARHREVSASCVRCGRSRARISSCSSWMRRKVSPRRTCISPAISPMRRAAWCSSSTNGTSSRKTVGRWSNTRGRRRRSARFHALRPGGLHLREVQPARRRR